MYFIEEGQRGLLWSSGYLSLCITAPSNEYYVPGSPQHAKSVRTLSKVDRENGTKVKMLVYYTGPEKGNVQDKNSGLRSHT